MQQTGQPELLSVLSIILSISCLASKGYVAAFSVNFRTFVFNGICIAADTLGIFATVSWLSGGSSSSLVAAACGWWYWLAGWAIVPGVIAGGSILFSEEVCDEWHRWVDIWNGPFAALRHERSRSKLFDIVIGGCICVMGFLPFLVVVLSTKLALLPLCALGSMDHHGQNTNRGLFDWVMRRDTPLRLWCTANVLLQCVDPESKVRSQCEQSTLHNEWSRKRHKAKGRLISELFKCVNDQEQLRQMQDGSLETADLRAAAECQNNNIVWATTQYWCADCTCLSDLAVVLCSGLSEIWCLIRWHDFWFDFDLPKFKKDIRAFLKNGCTHNSVTPGTRQWQLATFGRCVSTVFATVAAINAVAFVPFSIFFPVVCMGSHLVHGSGSSCWLETILSAVYVSLLVLLVLLSKDVLRFAAYQEMVTVLLSYLHEGSRSSYPRRQLKLDVIKQSYQGWIVGCQVQKGLVGLFGFGNGMPQMIHESLRKERDFKLGVEALGNGLVCTSGSMYSI